MRGQRPCGQNSKRKKAGSKRQGDSRSSPE
jgi:hypothetical protein